MTLPANGTISLSQVNTELTFASTTPINMNQTDLRTLFGVPTANAQISMSNGWGKTKPSSGQTLSMTISTNTAYVDLGTYAYSAGWNGSSPLTFNVTIASGVYITGYATDYASYIFPAIICPSSFPAGSVINLINNGYIGGVHGNRGLGSYSNGIADNGGPSGLAMYVDYPINITNANGWIYSGGGGGGGGAGDNNWYWSSTGSSGDLYPNYSGGSGGDGAGHPYNTNGAAHPLTGFAGTGGYPSGAAGGTGGAGMGVAGNAGANGGTNNVGGGGAGGGPGASGGHGGNAGGGTHQAGVNNHQIVATLTGTSGSGGTASPAIVRRNSATVTFISGAARVYGGIV